MSKTVFVFGAGFSIHANVPVQNEIMKSISDDIKEKLYFKDSYALYNELFHITSIKQMEKIPLEDVFTFLDRAISSREDTNTLPLDVMLARQTSAMLN